MPEPQPIPSDAELTRFLMGAANPAEVQVIERWLEIAPEHQQRLDDLKLLLGATEPPRMQWDAEASWRRLAERLEPASQPEVVRPIVRRVLGVRQSKSGLTWLRRALVAAGLGAVSLGGWYLERHYAARPTAAVATSVTERRTGRGERMSFRLADGTGVMLGPASRLRYSADFGPGGRMVELEGDGYFQVVHDSSRPFTVRTPMALVRDLGTRFAVRVRPRDHNVEVLVAEGSVAVGRAATPDSIVLLPGDLARLADSGPASLRRRVDVQRYLGWTEGSLVFERAPLPKVIDELERWYDVDIQLASGDLKSRVLTATFRDKPINEVLALLAASLDINVSTAGQRFVLSDR